MTALSNSDLYSNSQLTAPSGVAFDKYADAAAATIDPIATHLTIAGYFSAGDYGGAIYRRVSVGPYQLTTADGSRWAIAEPTLLPEMFGKNLQAAIDTAYVFGCEVAIRGTVALTVPAMMRAGVKLRGLSGALITQQNGAGLGTLIDFSAYQAHGASIEGCILDGNRAGNALLYYTSLIHIGAANDVIVKGNILRNSTGIGIHITNGLKPTIADNAIINCYTHGIVILPTTIQTPTFAQIINNEFSEIGNHAIGAQHSDFNTIQCNKVFGHQVLGMRVSISGTTVTWLSGSQFTAIRPGNFLILNGGQEFWVASVQSPTSLTITTPASLTNVPCIAGPGDLIGLSGCNEAIISSNHVLSGAGTGIILSNTPDSTCARNKIIGNSVLNAGCSGIGIQAVASPHGVIGSSIIGNTVTDAGQQRAAGNAFTNTGILILGSTTKGTYLSDNTVTDNGGTMPWGISIGNELSNGSVYVGKNTITGSANKGIRNAVGDIVLHSGWGIGRLVKDVVSTGDSISFVIEAKGTGQAFQPSIIVNTRATTIDNHAAVCVNTGSSAGIVSMVTYAASPEQLVLVYNATPSPSSVTRYACKC